MQLDVPPLFDRLRGAKRVLLAGAGGGFDVFAGLPLFFHLEARGVEVHLANLSFSALARVKDARGERLTPHVVAVDADADGDLDYFPEKHLAGFFRTEGRDTWVHCFEKVGVVPLTEAYRALVADLGVDAVVLVDGGTDSLMRGDEAGLGTPVEDMASIAAVHALDVPVKILTCLGFGIDAFHGVSHAHVLEAIAELSRAGAFLGTFSLHPEMPEVKGYIDAVEHVHRAMPARPSIVNGSILSALEGHFGDHHRTERTRGSELFINPLMAQYFSFDLDAVAERVLYLPMLAHTKTAFEIAAIIEAFHHEQPLRPKKPLPM
jgi:hypothetical protein